MSKLSISIMHDLKEKKYYFIVKQLDGYFKYDSSVDEYFYCTREKCKLASLKKKEEINKMLINR